MLIKLVYTRTSENEKINKRNKWVYRAAITLIGMISRVPRSRWSNIKYLS